MKRLPTYLAIELVLIALLQNELRLDTTHLTMTTLTTIALTAIATATRTTPTTPHPRWPHDRRDRRAGSRDDVTSLAWTFFGRDDTISAQALSTIRTLTANRLHPHGANLHDPHDAPTCQHLLGKDVYTLLNPTNPPTTPRPNLTQLDHIITTLENLTTTPPRTRTTP